jgi:DNA polymerase III epsilon subunit-like protein
MASDEVMISKLQCHPVDLSASGRRRDGVDQHFVSLRCMAVGVPAKPGPVQHTEVLFAGDAICVYDLETTGKNAATADPVDVSCRFLKVASGAGGRLELAKLVAGTNFDTLVRPLSGNIPEEATAVHGITIGMVTAEGVPALSAMKMALGAAITAAAKEAGQRPQKLRVWMLGHNSNVYDMKVMACALERAEGQAGSWLQLLEESGVVGVIDSLALLSKAFSAVAGVTGQTGKKLTAVYGAVFSGKELPNAHRAAGDVEGLVEIVLTSESMKSCILQKAVGMTLAAWSHRQQELARRLAWEKARDAWLGSGGRWGSGGEPPG